MGLDLLPEPGPEAGREGTGGRVGQDFHREFLEEPASKYEVAYEAVDEVGGVSAHRLRLIPKDPASYRSATLWIDRGTPVLRRLRVEEENGTMRTITLEEVALGVTPPDGWFDFTPPDGALVITR